MYDLSTLVVTGLISLLAGGVIGAFLTRSLRPQEQQNRELENRLQQAENKLADYQDEVSRHFAETSQLVNKLTQSYKDVHEFLASEALKLSNPEISRQIIEAADGKLVEGKPKADDEDAVVEPPRDWAPKEPGQTGQLSEEYGLEKEEEPATPPVR